MHIVSAATLTRVGLGPLVDPLREREAAMQIGHLPDPNRVVADLQQALLKFARTGKAFETD
jgi:hypothetical protein